MHVSVIREPDTGICKVKTAYEPDPGEWTADFRRRRQTHCSACGNGTTRSGRTTYVIDRDRRVAVIRDVPAQICEQCGEVYFDAKTAQALYDQAERILAHGSEVEITKFAA